MGKQQKRAWRQIETDDCELNPNLKKTCNASLFVVDKVADKVKTSKPEKVLLPASVRKALSKIKNRQSQACPRPTKLPESYDVWNTEKKDGCASDWTNVYTKPTLRRSNKSLCSVSVLSGFASKTMDPCLPGSSYNPDKGDQTRAIELAYAAHVEEIKDETAWKNKMEQARASEVGTEEEVPDDVDCQDSPLIVINPPTRAESRLTKAVKNKRLRHKQALREIKLRKSKQKLLQQIDIVKKLKPMAKVKVVREKTPRPSRLGKLMAKPEFPAVLLSDEVTHNLRTSKVPVHNIQDMFHRLQRRGLIEVREKAKRVPIKTRLYTRYKDVVTQQ
uniref:Ribosome biogenesis protein NOP53 n=1 Tax=Spongospora subterranea TaxID=70186 RepID=A0A0H5QYA6_9EUKA|eukprot:CRZ06968.1 hypothetical protein [Spongospora subterranea]